MSKVFIFGCGYLGLHLVDALHAQGFTVGAQRRIQVRLSNWGERAFVEVIESAWVGWLAQKIASDYACGQLRQLCRQWLEWLSFLLLWRTGVYRSMGTLAIDRAVYYTSSTSVYSKDNGSWVDEGVDSLGVEWTGSETGRFCEKRVDDRRQTECIRKSLHSSSFRYIWAETTLFTQSIAIGGRYSGLGWELYEYDSCSRHRRRGT